MKKKTVKKTNKVPKTKKVKITEQSPFDFGLDTEQTLADTLCDKYLQVGVEEDAIDDAFIGAFHGLAHRMLRIFKKDFVLEIIDEMHQIAHEEDEDVCNDCKEKEKLGLLNEDRNKMH